MTGLTRRLTNSPGPSEIPAVETPRLRLRPHRREDFPACMALWADPYVTRYIGGKPPSREEVWARFLRYAGSWHWLGFGYWAVEELSTGQFIGELGYPQMNGHSILHSPCWMTPVAPCLNLAGYSRQNSTARVTPRKPPRSFCIIHPDHSASIRVAQKCGFLEFARPFYQTEPTILFTREGGVERF